LDSGGQNLLKKSIVIQNTAASIKFAHTVIFLVKIRLKTVECAQVNFHHQIRPIVGFLYADSGEIQPV
jgi:hypothetical protein